MRDRDSVELVMNTLKHRLHLLAYAWRTVGPVTMLRNTLRWSRDADARNSEASFDMRFGTDTTAELTPAEAAIPTGRRAAATMYMPSVEQDLEAMLEALAWPTALESKATFLDIGSGKARVVLLAAMRRFRAVLGVELSPVLHAIAQRNLECVRDRGALLSPVQLLLGDATELAVPDGPMIAYLYHPFREPIAAIVVDRLIASLTASPRPAAILYGDPTLQRPFDPRVFTRGSVFAELTRGERSTRLYRIGWSVWTNAAWLAEPRYAVG
jgi:SAM-dependent methyltransferase